MAEQIHKCGQCEKEFKSEAEYIAHKCEVTGFKPTEPEHLGEGFKAVSEAAVARGNKRAELEEAGKTPEEAVDETRDIGKVVA